MWAPVTIEEVYYYGTDPASVPNNRWWWRPLSWFASDLAELGELRFPQITMTWDRDVGHLVDDATRLHLFTGGAVWRGVFTYVRVHAIGLHGYQYLTLCFDLYPSRWFVGGGRHVKPLGDHGPDLDAGYGYAKNAREVY